MNKIRLEGKVIYYNEIIHSNDFKELYLKEVPLQKFASKVITNTKRPFITFYSKDRFNLNFNEKDILLIRAIKNNKQVQFVSKVYKWGKINFQSKFVKLLNIKNNERINFEIISRDKKLISKNNKNVIDLYNLWGDHLRIIPRENNYITVYSKQKIPITSPRFIRITPELLELFYLVHGDGHYKDKLYFSNKDPGLHNFVLNRFEDIFRIPKGAWKARILIHNLNFGDYAKFYWEKKLNLKEEQFYNISKSTLNTDKKGNLRIIIDKTIVSILFRFIFNQLKSLTELDSLYALNGLLYAEGGAQISKKGLHKITLSFNEKEKKMFKQILDNLNLNYTIEQNKNFVIQGWNNHYLFFKTFISKGIIPFKIHNQRRNNIINGFLNHSFTKTLNRYLPYLKEKNEFSIKEFSNLIGIRKDSILNMVRKGRYERFIKLEKKKFFVISITKEGLMFLDLINKIKDIRRNFMEQKLPFEEIERKTIIKKKATTDPNFGIKPDERSVDELINYGIVNVNKPSGPT